MEKKSIKALVIFDTTFGNTKTIAEAIAKELGNGAKAVQASSVGASELKGLDLLVAGSPIIGWKPSEKMEAFLNSLTKEQLKGVKAVAFDTRVKIFIHGDAARKISERLEAAGAEIVSKPQMFYVKGREGPLFDGEVEKSVEWAKSIKSQLKTK